MSSSAPDTSPITATTTNGTRNNVGRIVARAPIGSVPMASRSFASEPASSRPKKNSTTLARDSPVAVQPATPALDDVRGR